MDKKLKEQIMVVDALYMPMETEIPGEKTLEAGRGSVYLLVYRREGIVWGRERL